MTAVPGTPQNPAGLQYYSQISNDDVIIKSGTHATGLTHEEAAKRHGLYGPNIIRKSKISILRIFLRQFTGNPLIFILIVATFISLLLGQITSSYYIFATILVSIGLGLWNEFTAEKTVDSLLKKISLTALAERQGEKMELPVSQLTIGDIVLLSPGSIIPADVRLIESRNLEVDQSALTGETKTVYKTGGPLASAQGAVADFSNIGFMGTVVESGSAKGIVVQIGRNTQFGKIAEDASFIKPATNFQKGLSKFGSLVIKVVILMTAAIFLVNMLLGHEPITSLLFALAIAVGLTPELLPVIVTVSLSHGAGKLLKKHIVVKQLISIENLGNMDILCTDKTGTLTEGHIRVIDFINRDGRHDEAVLDLALICNSAYVHHKVLGNSIDAAILEHALKNKQAPKKVTKVDEEPFDFERKLSYTVIEEKDHNLLIVKGAPDNVLNACVSHPQLASLKSQIHDLGREGLRLVAVATRKIARKDAYSWDDIKGLEYRGFISFLDVAKKSAKEALEQLRSLNVKTKIVTGDNELVTEKILNEIGMPYKKVLLGPQIDSLSDEELAAKVTEADIFAKASPEQKLRIIKALQGLGHTVGYMGDGINDLPALHAADVGISVNTAVDVAKDAASVVILRKSLETIADGIIEGRKTFNNTIKYILMSTSSNFGNMFSAAAASVFLPFLPMTPVQILLTNALYDISQMSLPSDNVDPESLVKPRHWNINFIKNYMIFFGPLSSLFDFITFAIMIYVFHAAGALFQTGWFIESIATEILVVFVIRTARTPFFVSRPGTWLLIGCIGMTVFAAALPFSPLASHLGFVTPPIGYFAILLVLVIAYLTLVETVKNLFLKKYIL